MLELLRIHDLALIEDIEMEFAPGMNVLTGETGAGKSFILKALNFLTGDKLGTDLVRPGKEKATVEALFVLNGEDVILRRELAAETGRSRVYLNDRLCSQEVVRDLRPKLILHTSQHGQQKLLQPAFQAAILDDFIARHDLLEERDRMLRSLTDCSARIAALDRTRQSLEDKREVLEFQQAEIHKVGPKPGEEEELELKRAVFRNQAAVQEHAGAALGALHGDDDGPGLYRHLARFEKAVETLAAMLDDLAEAPELLVQVKASLHDLEAQVRKTARSGEQEADIEAIEARLYALAQLKRKLKRPLESIIALEQEITENIAFLDNAKLERSALEQEERELCDALAGVLAELNPARKTGASVLEKALQDELKGLGFSEHVRVNIEFSAIPLFAGRSDCTELKAKFLWQPNPGQPPQPLDKIASGGELSRFLLAVVSLLSKNTAERPTLIFDEVDSGVGGLTLNRVGDSLEALAGRRQMLLITHWPQLASRAGRHFMVEKEVLDDQTYTRCTRLGEDEIEAELARMSGRAG